MVIEPKVRGFICTTAHPAGCRENVRRQVEYIKSQPKTEGKKRALVIGCSTGYGLASRIALAFSGGADTLGVMYEKPSNGKKCASAGWYNTAAFEEFAALDGLYAKTLNGDAFSREMKEQTAALIRSDLGQVDTVVYSVATARCTGPDGVTHTSVLKTTGAPFTNLTIDLAEKKVLPVTVEPATQEEIDDTICVMGGGDWAEWIRFLKEEGLLAPGAVTLAYSYIGPELTHPIYYDGTIGKAKDDLLKTARRMTESGDVSAFIAVNKALVTQSSAAIPVVPLYITILYKIMKEKGLHEGCIEQMYRLFHDKLPQGAADGEPCVLRLDDWEMRPDVQEAVQAAWEKISDETLPALCDIEGYWEDFYRMFGFGLPGVDYGADADPAVPVPSLA